MAYLDIFILLSRYIFIGFMLIFLYITSSFLYKLPDKLSILDKQKTKLQYICIFFFNLAAYSVLIAKESEKDLQIALVKNAILFILIVTITGWILRILKRGREIPIYNIIFFMMNIGLVMLERLNHNEANKQIIWYILGLSVAIFIPKIFKFFIHPRFKTMYAIFAWIFMLMPFSIGKVHNGANNWIIIGEFGFQPSEIVKIILVFYLASALAGKENMKLRYRNLIIPIMTVGGYLICLVLQRDLGAALIYFLTALTMVYIATNNILIYLSGIGSGVISAIIGYKLFAHVRVRVEAWQDPWKDISGKGYQIVQSLFAIGTWGWLGSGLTRGYPNKIPIVTSDFIFAAICEEFGNLFALGVILLYLMLILYSIRKILRVKDNFLTLIGVGLINTLAIQTVLIIGGVIKLIPLTGVTLPFISYGGSSIIVSVFMIGLLQYVNGYVEDEDTKDSYETTIGIIQMASLYAIIFVMLMSYLSYFVIVKSKDIVIHTHNRRMDPLENEVVRGDILSGDGQIIATTIEGATSVRNYPQERKYAHIVGYTQRGKTGVEALANVELLRANYNLESIYRKTFNGDKFIGRDVVITIDHQLQEVAYNALGNQKGVVVLIEPSTGKIKALVSKPDFDANKISQTWETLIEDNTNSPLLNRALFGLYLPGSIFKIITTQAFFDNRGNNANMSYDCTGSITVDNHTIRCFNQTAHGNINLEEAFTKSCNTYFVNIGIELGAKKLKKTGEQLLFNSTLPIGLEHSKSQLLINNSASDNELAATYIGQGKTLVTPIHMAMIAAAIANDGVVMKPYILDYSKDKKGNIKTKTLPEYVSQIFQSDDARRLEQMMVQVVTQGTGSKAAAKGVYVGGKTGTAQNETDEDHSWFIGFVGKNQESELAMAIIVENGGKGAQASVVAGKIVKAYQSSN